jgi:hypothetical protein
LREFGKTKIVAIDVLTEDDVAICDLGDSGRRRAYSPLTMTRGFFVLEDSPDQDLGGL